MLWASQRWPQTTNAVRLALLGQATHCSLYAKWLRRDSLCRCFDNLEHRKSGDHSEENPGSENLGPSVAEIWAQMRWASGRIQLPPTWVWVTALPLPGCVALCVLLRFLLWEAGMEKPSLQHSCVDSRLWWKTPSPAESPGDGTPSTTALGNDSVFCYEALGRGSPGEMAFLRQNPL